MSGLPAFAPLGWAPPRTKQVRLPSVTATISGMVKPVGYVAFETEVQAAVAVEAVDGIYVQYQQLRVCVCTGVARHYRRNPGTT